MAQPQEDKLGADLHTRRRGPSLGRIAFVLAGTGIGILLLVLLLRSVNPSRLGNAFSQADYLYLLVAIIPWIVNLVLKVPRWSLLYGEEPPTYDTLFGAMTVGYAINTLLPARLGEIVRAYWVRDRGGYSMVRSLSTIALERVTDGMMLVVLLLVTAPTVAFPGKLLGSALTIGAVFLVVLLLMGVLAFGSSRPDGRVQRILRSLEAGRFSFAARLLMQVLTGLQVLRNRRALALLAIYTVIIWSSNVILAYLITRAFHVQVPITAAILLTAVLNLGMAVPSSPGYVGVYEYLMVLTLSLYGIHHAPALAAALAFHAIAFVPVTLIGLVYIVRSGVETTLQMVRQEERTPVVQ
jgi:glycosyltransferase 2 family protein